MGRGIATKLLGALLLWIVAGSALAEPPRYKFSDITPEYLDGHKVRNAMAIRMASNGLVCGQAYVDGLQRQVGWTCFNGQYKLIDNPSGKPIYLSGCNSKGEVVGQRDSDAINNPTSTPIVSKNGVFVDLPIGASYSGTGLGINDDGIIVGGLYDEYHPDAPQYLRFGKMGRARLVCLGCRELARLEPVGTWIQRRVSRWRCTFA